MNVSRRTMGIVFGVAAAVLLQGCSTLWGPKPDIVSEEKAPGQVHSNADKRRVLIDQPQLLSGDYFRERTDAPSGGIRFKIPGTDGSVSGPAAPAGAHPPASEENRIVKLGVATEDGIVDSPAIRAFTEAISRTLPGNFRVVDPLVLAGVIAGTGCPNRGDWDCLGREAAVYPGIRILIVPETVRLPDAYPGTAEVRFRLFDAGLGYGYPVREMAERVQTAADLDLFLARVSEAVFADAGRSARTMPRHGRVFSVKSGRIYINAGKASQVNIGDTFTVVPGGEILKAPSGIPVGWISGGVEATIRIESYVGEDAAGCSLVSGAAPAVGDYVMFDER